MSKYVSAENLKYYNDKILQIIEAGDSINTSISVELGTNGSLGGYKTGDTISPGTSLENVLKKLLAKQIPPTYTAPTVSIINNGGTAQGNYEIGSLITPKIKAVYNKNDGGNIEYIDILRNSSSVMVWEDVESSYEENEQILSNTLSFKANAAYEEGPIKNDNLGSPYPAGHIAAGVKASGNYTFIPYRQGYFWGILDTSSVAQPLNSAIIRNGIKKNAAYSSGNITGIRASAVQNRKRIFIACPAVNTGVTKVIMPSAMNADCTADFIKQENTVLVEGANGYEGIAYNVWVYEPAVISDDQTFTVTLG